MDQSYLLVSIGASVLSTVIVLIIFFFLYLRKFKSGLRSSYDEKLEEIRSVLQNNMEELLQRYRTDLKTEQDDRCNELRQLIEKNFREDIQIHKEDLKTLTHYELELFKSKIRNIQPSYPKRLEAQQKLAVLIDSIFPQNELFTNDGVTTDAIMGVSFENSHKLLKQFMMDYSGIIGDATEKILSACIDACSDGMSGKNVTSLLFNDLLLAKKSLKKEFASAKEKQISQ